jgi:uncharacterized protein (TIGR00375 family)
LEKGHNNLYNFCFGFLTMDFKREEVMFCDLHMHSRFSRACSKDLNFPNLVKWARIKGLDLLGTSDFTHPVWIEEIKDQLVSNRNGLYLFKEDSGKEFPFIISGEVSLMYTQGRGRRVHLVLLVPSIEVAEKINSYLDTKGRRDYDGRPIFKIPVEEFTREMMKISKEIEVIPAHIWTPWFGIFGSATGYDSLKEAFGEQLENIHAVETGISSDPEMNWKIKELENISIVSFSDSHSFWPYRMGREATIFNKLNSYQELIKQLRENDFIGTIEVESAYGKYHYDGHRNCEFSCGPEKTKELGGICPICSKKLTVGVEFRVEELADQIEGFRPKNAKLFYKLLPLHEIISLYTGVGMASKTVWRIYDPLIEKFGNEFNVLLNVSKEELASVVEENLADLIITNRQGLIQVKPGYDGVYGETVVEGKTKKEMKKELVYERGKNVATVSEDEKQVSLS